MTPPTFPGVTPYHSPLLGLPHTEGPSAGSNDRNDSETSEDDETKSPGPDLNGTPKRACLEDSRHVCRWNEEGKSSKIFSTIKGPITEANATSFRVPNNTTLKICGVVARRLLDSGTVMTAVIIAGALVGDGPRDITDRCVLLTKEEEPNFTINFPPDVKGRITVTLHFNGQRGPFTLYRTFLVDPNRDNLAATSPRSTAFSSPPASVTPSRTAHAGGGIHGAQQPPPPIYIKRRFELQPPKSQPALLAGPAEAEPPPQAPLAAPAPVTNPVTGPGYLVPKWLAAFRTTDTQIPPAVNLIFTMLPPDTVVSGIIGFVPFHIDLRDAVFPALAQMRLLRPDGIWEPLPESVLTCTPEQPTTFEPAPGSNWHVVRLSAEAWAAFLRRRPPTAFQPTRYQPVAIVIAGFVLPQMYLSQ